jgi:hypothetical protein
MGADTNCARDYDSSVLDDNLSITGRPVPRLAITPEDRSRLFAFVYPFAHLPRAVQEGDWMYVGFCVIGLAGLLLVHRYGQAIDSRSLAEKLVFIGVVAVAATLVIIPDSPTWRAVGLALVLIPFLLDIALAQRAHSVG